MARIPVTEFERLPLRVHSFLAGVPLRDAWMVELPRSRGGITLDEFRRQARGALFQHSRAARTLMNVRALVGGALGWDRLPPATVPETFADRLTAADRARSLAPPGGRADRFRLVYRFENEQLVEVRNRTVHAAMLTALVETASTYRFYLAVYVRAVGPFTPLYMALIDPFRKLVVYRSLLRGVETRWRQAMR